MVAVPAGSFIMGSDEKAIIKKVDEQPAHKVTIEAFWMGAYEVTYDEYDEFSKDQTLSHDVEVDAVARPTPPYIDLTLGMGKEGGFPANSMQQFGAIMYCKWLYKKTGVFFRIPTEAEWEYACRAGSTTAYPFGNDSSALGKYAWYAKNSGGHYHKVGELQPNNWGLYDMLGNVGEWTLDQYNENFYSKTTDGANSPLLVPTTKHPRVVRGGTYRDDADITRSAARIKSDAVWNRRDPQVPKSKWWNADAPFIGFRIIRPLKQPTADEAAAFYDQYLKK
ncbi:MAG TPA: SUMF1/EgtB/PvdO family nonheme iron enzyme [Panacibacter sp.]|nr:SUMF1/EgtB/PvdO family nonheme iron enzyme [Panacibacter sp.]HNP46234.1 SUMF1/EgtB/PvdO family nonheme iron enzyme [Panacibacter sp.]